MIYTLSTEDRNYLRSLARRQAEIAALPVMAARKRMWTEMNDGKPGARPPFAVETWTFDRDFMPESIYRCRSEYSRQLENRFLRNIRQHELLDDDHVCPDTLDLNWHILYDEFGIEIATQYVKDAEGVLTGYQFDHPITDLSQGMGVLKPAAFSVDRAGTLAEKALLEEVFGDILPVALRSGTFGRNNLTQRLMHVMSQENMFLALYEAPELLHRLMAMLCDNAKRMSRWAEAEGLLVLNNQNQCTCGTCYNFTTQLPREPRKPGQVRLQDMWAVMDSQETVGVSPEMFHEFFYPYYRELAELFGLVYWGCCEPADPIWEDSISKLPNLKAVSISRWANQTYMAEALAGKGIVYSRKPNPNLLGVDRELNEAAWIAEIRSTLDVVAAKDLPHEFIVRDVYTMHGNLAKAKRAVDLARKEIDRVHGPLAS